MKSMDGVFLIVLANKQSLHELAIEFYEKGTNLVKIVDSLIIKIELEKLGKVIRHITNMDYDEFLVNGKPYILEMNARFGGGYSFSHMRGCNLPKAIVKCMMGEEVSKEN